MSESGKESIGPTASMSGRRVDFGRVGEDDGLAWGIEVDIDISDRLARSRFQGDAFKIPDHVKAIKYLDLAPQEALPPDQRTIRSKRKPHSFFGGSLLIPVATPAPRGNPKLEKIRKDFKVLRSEDEARFKLLQIMVSWSLMTEAGKKRFNEILQHYGGDTLVIVYGHSADLSSMGEQYSMDRTVDETGKIIQRAGNSVPIDSILGRYNDPNKFTAIVLYGCNTEGGIPKVKKVQVPVFYPTDEGGVKETLYPGFFWSKPGGVILPE